MAGVSTPFAFPFCIGSGTPTPGDVSFPIDQTFETIFEWFWRIKAWEVTITPDDPLVGSPVTQIFTVDPTVETELVCLGFGNLLTETQNFDFPDVGLTVNFTFRLFVDEGSGQVAILDSGSYYPSIWAADQSGVPIVSISSLTATSFSARIETDVIFAGVTFAAIEWWPYNPGDGGGPVWDSSDGSPLRDPFSIQSWN